MRTRNTQWPMRNLPCPKGWCGCATRSTSFALLLLFPGVFASSQLVEGKDHLVGESPHRVNAPSDSPAEMPTAPLGAPFSSHVTRRLFRQSINLSPGDDLNQAVFDALAPAELILADGTYTGVGPTTGGPNMIYIIKDITIRALNPGQAVLDGENTRRVIYVNGGSLVLEGLVITRGFSDPVRAHMWILDAERDLFCACFVRMDPWEGTSATDAFVLSTLACIDCTRGLALEHLPPLPPEYGTARSLSLMAIAPRQSLSAAGPTRALATHPRSRTHMGGWAGRVNPRPQSPQPRASPPSAPAENDPKKPTPLATSLHTYTHIPGHASLSSRVASSVTLSPGYMLLAL